MAASVRRHTRPSGDPWLTGRRMSLRARPPTVAPRSGEAASGEVDTRDRSRSRLTPPPTLSRFVPHHTTGGEQANARRPATRRAGFGCRAAAFMAPSASARGPSPLRPPLRPTSPVWSPWGTGGASTSVPRSGQPDRHVEGGLHATADVWSVPEDPSQPQPAVLPTLAATTHVCAYDRPGTAIGPENLSRSNAVRMPRTTGAMVTDLHRVTARGEASRAVRVRRALDWRHDRPAVHHSTSGERRGPGARRSTPETMDTDLSISDWNTYDQQIVIDATDR